MELIERERESKYGQTERQVNKCKERRNKLKDRCRYRDKWKDINQRERERDNGDGDSGVINEQENSDTQKNNRKIIIDDEWYVVDCWVLYRLYNGIFHWIYNAFSSIITKSRQTVISFTVLIKTKK